MTERYTDLIHNSLQEFGRLLREVCEAAGFTQAKLSRESEDERGRLIESGDLSGYDPCATD